MIDPAFQYDIVRKAHALNMVLKLDTIHWAVRVAEEKQPRA